MLKKFFFEKLYWLKSYEALTFEFPAILSLVLENKTKTSKCYISLTNNIEHLRKFFQFSFCLVMVFVFILWGHYFGDQNPLKFKILKPWVPRKFNILQSCKVSTETDKNWKSIFVVVWFDLLPTRRDFLLTNNTNHCKQCTVYMVVDLVWLNVVVSKGRAFHVTGMMENLLLQVMWISLKRTMVP